MSRPADCTEIEAVNRAAEDTAWRLICALAQPAPLPRAYRAAALRLLGAAIDLLYCTDAAETATTPGSNRGAS